MAPAVKIDISQNRHKSLFDARWAANDNIRWFKVVNMNWEVNKRFRRLIDGKGKDSTCQSENTAFLLTKSYWNWCFAKHPLPSNKLIISSSGLPSNYNINWAPTDSKSCQHRYWHHHDITALLINLHLLGTMKHHKNLAKAPWDRCRSK